MQLVEGSKKLCFDCRRDTGAIIRNRKTMPFALNTPRDPDPGRRAAMLERIAQEIPPYRLQPFRNAHHLRPRCRGHHGRTGLADVGRQPAYHGGNHLPHLHFDERRGIGGCPQHQADALGELKYFGG